MPGFDNKNKINGNFFFLSMKVFKITNLDSQIDLRWNEVKGTLLDKPVRVFPRCIALEMKIFLQNG